MKHLKTFIAAFISLPIVISACTTPSDKYDCVIRTYSGDVYYADKNTIEEKDNTITFIDKLNKSKTSITHQYSVQCKG